ncbi:MAG: hypothetical protein ACOWWR_18930, partial [Eubacteriales bacterium]
MIFSQKKKIYDQIRYIDQEGNEIIRIHQYLINNYIEIYLISLIVSGLLLWFSIDQYFKRKSALK